MMDYFEYIDDYKNGLLKGDLLQQFEKELAINESLQQAVEDHDVTAMALDLLLEEDIRSVMNEENSAVEEDKKMMGIKSYLIFMLVALVIGAIGYVMNKEKGPKHEVLFAQNFTPYIEKGDRGDKASFDALLVCDKAHYYMTKRKYIPAKESFQKSIKIGEDCPKAKWYLALEYLREQNYEKCKYLLGQITEDDSHPYYTKAKKLIGKL